MTAGDGVFDEAVAARYDESLAEMFDPKVVDPAVDFLAALAGGGTALELGIGTGRIGLPLAQRGVAVQGIEMSRAMVAKMQQKPGAEKIPVTIGDFTATKALQLERSALSYQLIPPGYRFPYGHTHKKQEEVYVVVRGSGRMKVDDEIVELKEWDAVRVPPGTWRGYEAGPEGLEILVIGAPNLGEAPREDVHGQRGWWAD